MQLFHKVLFFQDLYEAWKSPIRKYTHFFSCVRAFAHGFDNLYLREKEIWLKKDTIVRPLCHQRACPVLWCSCMMTPRYGLWATHICTVQTPVFYLFHRWHPITFFSSFLPIIEIIYFILSPQLYTLSFLYVLGCWKSHKYFSVQKWVMTFLTTQCFHNS